MLKPQLTVEEDRIMKYPRMTWGKMEAVINKLGGEEGVERLLCGELLVVSDPTRKFYERCGIFYFSVTSRGKTGPDWIDYFEKSGSPISAGARKLLLSPDFKPTAGVTTRIAMLSGWSFSEGYRVTANIRHTALALTTFTEPNAEVACLVCAMFTKEALQVVGLSRVVVMHEAIDDDAGIPLLLTVEVAGQRLGLGTCYGGIEGTWPPEYSFVFGCPDD